jgi:sugar phosphate isomerase/epimerase
MPGIALQLYTVRDQLGQDPRATVQRVAEIGYRAAEIDGAERAQVGPLLGRNGIRTISAHLSLDAIVDPTLILTELADLGCGTAALSSLPRDRRQTVSAVREVAGIINHAAQTASELGLRFGYHNHAFEFEPLEGTNVFDILAQETDPEKVFFELDVYWLARGGVDPSAQIEAMAGRVPVIHVKDMADDEAHSFAPVGTGVLDWDRILGAAAASGSEWYVVEQDVSKDPFTDIATSLRNLEGRVG